MSDEFGQAAITINPAPPVIPCSSTQPFPSAHFTPPHSDAPLSDYLFRVYLHAGWLRDFHRLVSSYNSLNQQTCSTSDLILHLGRDPATNAPVFEVITPPSPKLSCVTRISNDVFTGPDTLTQFPSRDIYITVDGKSLAHALKSATYANQQQPQLSGPQTMKKAAELPVTEFSLKFEHDHPDLPALDVLDEAILTFNASTPDSLATVSAGVMVLATSTTDQGRRRGPQWPPRVHTTVPYSKLAACKTLLSRHTQDVLLVVTPAGMAFASTAYERMHLDHEKSPNLVSFTDAEGFLALPSEFIHYYDIQDHEAMRSLCVTSICALGVVIGFSRAAGVGSDQRVPGSVGSAWRCELSLPPVPALPGRLAGGGQRPSLEGLAEGVGSVGKLLDSTVRERQEWTMKTASEKSDILKDARVQLVFTRSGESTRRSFVSRMAIDLESHHPPSTSDRVSALCNVLVEQLLRSEARAGRSAGKLAEQRRVSEEFWFERLQIDIRKSFAEQEMPNLDFYETNEFGIAPPPPPPAAPPLPPALPLPHLSNQILASFDDHAVLEAPESDPESEHTDIIQTAQGNAVFATIVQNRQENTVQTQFRTAQTRSAVFTTDISAMQHPSQPPPAPPSQPHMPPLSGPLPAPRTDLRPNSVLPSPLPPPFPTASPAPLAPPHLSTPTTRPPTAVTSGRGAPHTSHQLVLDAAAFGRGHQSLELGVGNSSLPPQLDAPAPAPAPFADVWASHRSSASEADIGLFSLDDDGSTRLNDD